MPEDNVGAAAISEHFLFLISVRFGGACRRLCKSGALVTSLHEAAAEMSLRDVASLALTPEVFKTMLPGLFLNFFLLKKKSEINLLD